VALAAGGDAILVEGSPLLVAGTNLCGKPFEEYRPSGVSYDESAGAGPPEQRLVEQDRDRVEAEVLFPGLGASLTSWRRIGNSDVYLALVRAYNDWLALDYCALAPNRLVGVGLIPEAGADAAISELRRIASMGLHAVVLNSFPAGHSFPSEDDDDFYREAIDLGVALTIHVNLGFRSTGRSSGTSAESGPAFRYPSIPQDLGAGALDMVRRFGGHGIRGALNAAQLVMSGVFVRIPALQIDFAENQIGWVPHFLEQFDDVYERNRYWMAKTLGMAPLTERPSFYIRQHCLWGFMKNPFGVRVRHEIGVDRIMWASDFPHGETDWPRSREVAQEIFTGVPAPEVSKMVHDNAISFFNIACPVEGGASAVGT